MQTSFLLTPSNFTNWSSLSTPQSCGRSLVHLDLKSENLAFIPKNMLLVSPRSRNTGLTRLVAGTTVVFYATLIFCPVVLADKNCPYGWVKHGRSCYFAGTAWTRLTYYDAMAFCLNFGGHLVEFNNMEEYTYITSTAVNYPWWNGPWIGLMKPFEGYDKSWVLPSRRTVTKDSDLNKIIDTAALKDNNRCGGLNRRGSGFGFWDCGGQDSWTSEPQKGSPWCEIELDD